MPHPHQPFGQRRQARRRRSHNPNRPWQGQDGRHQSRGRQRRQAAPSGCQCCLAPRSSRSTLQFRRSAPLSTRLIHRAVRCTRLLWRSRAAIHDTKHAGLGQISLDLWPYQGAQWLHKLRFVLRRQQGARRVVALNVAGDPSESRTATSAQNFATRRLRVRCRQL